MPKIIWKYIRVNGRLQKTRTLSRNVRERIKHASEHFARRRKHEDDIQQIKNESKKRSVCYYTTRMKAPGAGLYFSAGSSSEEDESSSSSSGSSPCASPLRSSPLHKPTTKKKCPNVFDRILEWEKESAFKTEWTPPSKPRNEMIWNILTQGDYRPRGSRERFYSEHQVTEARISEILAFRKPHKDWWKFEINKGAGRSKCKGTGKSIPYDTLRYEVSCSYPKNENWQNDARYWDKKKYEKYCATNESQLFVPAGKKAFDITDWKAFCEKTKGWWKFSRDFMEENAALDVPKWNPPRNYIPFH
jgi:hypothetical protein